LAQTHIRRRQPWINFNYRVLGRIVTQDKIDADESLQPFNRIDRLARQVRSAFSKLGPEW